MMLGYILLSIEKQWKIYYASKLGNHSKSPCWKTRHFDDQSYYWAFHSNLQKGQRVNQAILVIFLVLGRLLQFVHQQLAPHELPFLKQEQQRLSHFIRRQMQKLRVFFGLGRALADLLSCVFFLNYSAPSAIIVSSKHYGSITKKSSSIRGVMSAWLVVVSCFSSSKGPGNGKDEPSCQESKSDSAMSWSKREALQMGLSSISLSSIRCMCLWVFLPILLMIQTNYK